MVMDIEKEVDIVNLALNALEQDSINDINDNSIMANRIKLVYDITRKRLLESYNWNFAMSKTRLEPITLSKLEMNNYCSGTGYSFCYLKPENCLRIAYLVNSGGRLIEHSSAPDKKPYMLAGGKIYCNVSPTFIKDPDNEDVLIVDEYNVYVWYVSDFENVKQMPSYFKECWVRKIVLQEQPIVDGSNTKYGINSDMYEKSFSQAKSDDSKSGVFFSAA